MERLDLRPELSLPLRGDGWHLLASVAGRETFYTRSRQTPYTAGEPPIELTTPINRANVDFQLNILPPAIERTFEVPARLQNLFGAEIRHTIEPEFTYRLVHGVNNFLSILRFDDVDLASDTNELEYGATQHLYFRPRSRPTKPKPGCATSPTGATNGRSTRSARAPRRPQPLP